MLKSDLKPATRKWAIALIILNLLRIGTPFIAYFQAQYQIVTPLIPRTIVLDIIEPYMITGLVSLFLTVLAFMFFVYSKYTFSIITGLLNLGSAQLHIMYLHYYG